MRDELRQEILTSKNGQLTYTEARDLPPIPEWKMTAGELKRIPQFYQAIHAYSDTLPDHQAKQAFYFSCSLCDWEAAMRENMGGRLPVIGFYEMKQDITERRTI